MPPTSVVDVVRNMSRIFTNNDDDDDEDDISILLCATKFTRELANLVCRT